MFLIIAWCLMYIYWFSVQQEKQNKMTLQNVSIVLSPTMQISHRVLNIFFAHSKVLFRDTVIKRYHSFIDTVFLRYHYKTSYKLQYCYLNVWHTHTHTHTHNSFTALDFVWDNPGEPVPEETSPTHTYHGHLSSFIRFLHLLWSITSPRSVYRMCLSLFHHGQHYYTVSQN